jgi:hypothetical protein
MVREPKRAKAVRNGLFNKIAGRFQEKSKSVKKAPAISQRTLITAAPA